MSKVAIKGLPDEAGTVLTSASSITQNSGPAFKAYNSGTDQAVSKLVHTKVILNAEEFDTDNCFDSVTNSRFTPNVAGYYQVNAQIYALATNLAYNYIQVYKNGTQEFAGIYGPYSGNANIGHITSLVYMNGDDDYLELYVQLSYGSGGSVEFLNFSNFTSFSASLVRKA